MQVSEILKVKGNALFTIAPEGRLSEAVSVMAQHNMGSLVVMDKGRMIGILTFREILPARATFPSWNATGLSASSPSATSPRRCSRSRISRTGC